MKSSNRKYVIQDDDEDDHHARGINITHYEDHENNDDDNTHLNGYTNDNNNHFSEQNGSVINLDDGDNGISVDNSAVLKRSSSNVSNSTSPTRDLRFFEKNMISLRELILKKDSALQLKEARKWLIKVIYAQIVGNFIRALPAFILEKYFVMLLLFFEFLFLGFGYFGVKNFKPHLIGVYVLGNIATTITDFVIASTYSRSNVDHLLPTESTIAISLNFLLVISLCILNLIGALALGARLFISIMLLRNPKDYRLLVLASSWIGSFDSDDDNKKKKEEVHRSIYRDFQGQDSRDLIDGRKEQFLSNVVFTSKYNMVTFLPKVLYFQFSRVANLYTLAIVILCMFSFSPVGPMSSFTPLFVVVFVSSVKEFIEDRKRQRQDNEINNRESSSFQFYNKDDKKQGGDFKKVAWRDIKVGDIVMVTDGQLLPADLVLISTSRSDGRCYLETANLDGETNLKIRTVPTKCSFIKAPTDIATLQCKLDCEGPNNNIYAFDGVLTMMKDTELQGISKRESSSISPIKSRETIATPITPDNILLRGTQLRNTPWVYGLVVYTGKDTKIEQNSMVIPQKRSTVEKSVNMKLMFLFLLQTVICIICSVGHNNWYVETDDQYSPWYLGPTTSTTKEFIYVSYVILYNTLIPLSMYVSMETIRVINAHFINSDDEMYSPITNTPAQARNTNINEELGRIQFLFSDKTGTLTCNEMVFARCSVVGNLFGGFENKKARDLQSMIELIQSNHRLSSSIYEFLSLVAICNTVVLENTPDGLPAKGKKSCYQAASPDEEALVIAAAKLGFKLLSRENNIVTVEILGQVFTYEILNTIEFNSYRKRMSVIFRLSNGDIKIYVKGADTMILERLLDCDENKILKQTTTDHLREFASSGLRTLCMAWKTIEPTAYEAWNFKYQEASMSLVKRAEKVDEVAELIEKDLMLLGATGIEDRLQDGVNDCIDALRDAGIRVWVLTGDKQETAISIAHSSSVIQTGMDLIILNETIKEVLLEKLISIQEKYGLTPSTKGWKPVTAAILGLDSRSLPSIPFLEESEHSNDLIHDMAIVIDGATLDLALEPDMKYHFLQCAKACQSVVCCRCSPIQKAKVVKLVAEKSLMFGDGAITMAIGDGANDVPMILKAHVGVGISGKEGMQAVLASDFAISEFKMLKRLLLVHGNRSYRRITKLILYSFCKNIALCLSQFWFGFFSAFSGQMIYFDFLFTLYNALFTSFPVLTMGVLDQDVDDGELMRKPWMYRKGQHNKGFNSSVFLGWVALGIWQSFMVFIVPFLVMDTQINGHDPGFWVSGTTSYTVLVLMMTVQVALFNSSWTKFSVYAILGSLLLYMVFIFIYCGVTFVDPEAFFVIYSAMNIPNYWFVIIIAPIFGILPYITLRLNKLIFLPSNEGVGNYFEDVVTDRDIVMQELINDNNNTNTNDDLLPEDGSIVLT